MISQDEVDTTGYRIFWLQFWSKDEQSKKTKIIIRTKGDLLFFTGSGTPEKL